MLWEVVCVIDGKQRKVEVEGDSESDAIDNFRATYGYEARIKTITPQVGS